MTRAGIALILAGVVLYVLAGETQIGWFYLVDAMIWGLVVVSIAVPWWTLRTLKVDRQVWLPGSRNLDQEATPREDDMVEVKLKVANRGRLARHFIKVSENCPMEAPGQGTRAFLLSTVEAGKTAEFSYTATCYKRGRYSRATVVLESGAPVGLFVRRRRFDIPLNLTVYPAYYDIEGISGAGRAEAGEGDMVTATSANDFHGSREYQHGDPLRHIHWRNTARLGRFVVKQFEGANQMPIAVAFPTDQDFGEGKDTTLEYSIKIAASVGWQCVRLGNTLSILAGPTPLANADWLPAMGYLAGLSPGEAPSMVEAAAGESAETVVAVLPAARSDLIPDVIQLAESHPRLIAIVLEGFASAEAPDEFVSRLSGRVHELIRCPRGQLNTALAGLGRAWLPTPLGPGVGS